MTKDRREFLKLSALGAGALVTAAACAQVDPPVEGDTTPETTPETPVAPVVGHKPVVLSTWNHGMAANAAAWEILKDGGYALDASEAGVRVTESDPDGRSVGLGGMPDRTGVVTLDACVQNEKSDCGAVAFLQDIEHPVSVARKVMEETKHVMMVGEGAKQFALEQGFETRNLLVPEAEAAWKEWLEKPENQPGINSENHDTIGILALDADGRVCGACTTSGAAYKLHGRVGDSPIIGAGLFVDGDVGGAVATGLGEAVIRTAGSAMVVELMRGGMNPTEACRTIVERILAKHDNTEGLQVGFLALNTAGETGGYSVYAGFNYALTYEGSHELVDAGYKLEW